MYKVFVAFEGPDSLAPAVREIDEMVLRHHGPVVRRSHPLHLTVMAPRTVSRTERRALEQLTEEFNHKHSSVPCRLDRFLCFDRQRRRHFVVGVKGQQLIETIHNFHGELQRRLNWERRKFEGTTPHITFLNTKHVPPTIFERVTKEAKGLALPKTSSSRACMCTLNTEERRTQNQYLWKSQ